MTFKALGLGNNILYISGSQPFVTWGTTLRGPPTPHKLEKNVTKRGEEIHRAVTGFHHIQHTVLLVSVPACHYESKFIVLFSHHTLWSFYWCRVVFHIAFFHSKNHFLWLHLREGCLANGGKTHLYLPDDVSWLIGMVILKCNWSLK